MVAPLVGAAASLLLPILVNAGTDLLADIVRKKSPAAGKVVEKVGRAIGTDPTPKAIVAAHKASPDLVRQAVQQVESEDLEMWQAVVSEINQTMREEAKSDNVLQQTWRPVYAFELTLECFLTATAFVYLVYAGKTEMLKAVADISHILITYFGVRLTVLGVYVDGRRREKMAGVA